MAGPEGIVLAFFSFAKSGNASELSEGGEAVPSSREHFVGVALVGDVPDDVIFGHVEYVVEGDGEFDDAEGGGEVASGFGDGFDELPSEFVSELFEFFQVQFVHVVGVLDAVEDGFGGGAAVGRTAGGVVEAGGGLVFRGGCCSRGEGCEGRCGRSRGCQKDGRYCG